MRMPSCNVPSTSSDEDCPGYKHSCRPCKPKNKSKCTAPVNVVIVEEEEQSEHCTCLNDCCSSCVSFVHFVLGALTLSLVLYGVAHAMFSQDWHGILFGFGYLCFLIPGILIVNRYYGPAKVKTCPDQKFKHILFEVLGLAFQVVGIAMLIKGGFRFTPVSCMSLHKILGLMSIVFIAICSFTGVFVAKNGRCLCKFFHQVSSVFAFLATGACFTSGLLTPKFMDFSLECFKYKWPVVLVIFNTFLMVVVTLAICLNCGKRCR